MVIARKTPYQNHRSISVLIFKFFPHSVGTGNHLWYHITSLLLVHRPEVRTGLVYCSPRKVLNFRPSEITSGDFHILT